MIDLDWKEYWMCIFSAFALISTMFVPLYVLQEQRLWWLFVFPGLFWGLVILIGAWCKKDGLPGWW